MRPFTGEPKQSQRGDIYFTILESNLEQCQSQTFLLDAPIYAHTHLPVPLNLSFAALPTCPGICIGVLRVLFYTVLFHGKEILTRSVKGLKKGCSRWLHTYRYKWIPGSLPSSCQKKGSSTWPSIQPDDSVSHCRSERRGKQDKRRKTHRAAPGQLNSNSML